MNIRSNNPLPLVRLNTADEKGIVAMRSWYDSIYALTESGKINVYTNHPYQGLHLENVIMPPSGLFPSKGLDIDSDGFVWSFDNKTNDIIRIDRNGTMVGRIVKDAISNFCLSPSDLTTTCDGLIVVTDMCGAGRFFVLKYNDDAVAIEQYNDGSALPEPPSYVSTGPGGQIYFMGSNFVTVFGRKGNLAPYQFVTQWKHDMQFPRQLFVDQSENVFISGSSFEEGKSILNVSVL